MLELRQVRKHYPVGDSVVEALRGIDLQFRANEFVSILGPSGCGKTTLLNIIGGLDKYTSGDLIINGRHTKQFKDRDWDAYRNHSVGFVFQSYNLIPHQSVLQNVELALTLSGVSKGERRRRAKAALEQVGLGDQLKKKPSEMSGGQMQRVAIARALVNNPDIILADEPTGALDTETSVQVMELLKEVAKDRLVVMVTHNPELAETYSTRIIRMLDGVITDDSAPLTAEEAATELKKGEEKVTAAGKQRMPSMSIFTSFGLSLKNLFTKKGRTALTSFAGSIGIIGIALILSVSQGMTTYINMVQEDTLSSYPLSLQAQHMDVSTLLQTFIGAAQAAEPHENDAIYQKAVMYDMINALNDLEAKENDLASFKKYIEAELKKPENTALKEAVNGIQYTYDLDLLIYTKNIDGTIIRSDSTELLQSLIMEFLGMDTLGSLAGSTSSMSSMSMMMPGMQQGLWQELLPGDNGELVNPLLKKQYTLIDGGRWPAAYNEVVLVVDKNNELDDMALYALGLKSKDEIATIMNAVINGEEIEAPSKKWSYEEIRQMEFRTVLNSQCYYYDEATGTYQDYRDTEGGLDLLYHNGMSLKVVGIVKPNEDAVSAMLTGSIAYTSALTEYVIQEAADSAAIDAQLKAPHTDIFTGKPFKENTGTLTEAQKETAFREYIDTLDEAGKAALYVSIMSIPPQADVDAAVAAGMEGLTREDIEQKLLPVFMQNLHMDEADALEYLQSINETDLQNTYEEMLVTGYRMQYAAGVQMQLAGVPAAQLAGLLTAALDTYTPENFGIYYDELMDFSESSLESNLIALGHLDLEKPSSINLYASSFENKDLIEDTIATYNNSKEELEKITYTDYVGIMMSSITTIINAITYVLISFVAISLVVSSIMIGVITLISVQERTKEIGILRAIGASKGNVSGMFNAETLIIGAFSGLLGVGLTYLLCIPINAVIHALTGLDNLNAYLPWKAALVLVGISIVLTIFSGLIPSRSAAKKDPVVALRTE